MPGRVIASDGFFDRLHMVARLGRPRRRNYCGQALVAIHWVHRMFAMLVVVAVSALIWQLWRAGFLRLARGLAVYYYYSY
jgi:hypothetical protein